MGTSTPSVPRGMTALDFGLNFLLGYQLNHLIIQEGAGMGFSNLNSDTYAPVTPAKNPWQNSTMKNVSFYVGIVSLF